MTRRVRIPADVDRPDVVLAGLSARQLVILAVPAVALWTLHLAVRAWVPLPIFAAAAAPVVAVVVMVAVGRRDGLSGDRLALAGWRHLRAPRRVAPAPDGVPTPPDVTRDVATPSSPAPLTLPVRQVTGEAVVDLGRDGAAVLLACTASDLALWTTEEQDAAVAAFGRWCNAITGPVQLVVSAEPANLDTMTGRLVAAAPGLPHPALEAAAREHAAFLTSLAARHAVVRRQVWVVLRDPAPLHRYGGFIPRSPTRWAMAIVATSRQQGSAAALPYSHHRLHVVTCDGTRRPLALIDVGNATVPVVTGADEGDSVAIPDRFDVLRTPGIRKRSATTGVSRAAWPTPAAGVTAMWRRLLLRPGSRASD